jgi:hypothetical protein
MANVGFFPLYDFLHDLYKTSRFLCSVYENSENRISSYGFVKQKTSNDTFDIVNGVNNRRNTNKGILAKKSG